MKQIPLTQGKFALVDDQDYDSLAKFKWQFCKLGYARRNIGGFKACTLLMHRVIMNPSGDMCVDHIDGDRLNNTRANLRLATFAENRRNGKKHRDNTSGFKGVWFHKQFNKFAARIMINGQKKNLGLFLTAAEAGKAYDDAAIFFHREFARTNAMITDKI